jgi:hypothetical protein
LRLRREKKPRFACTVLTSLAKACRQPTVLYWTSKDYQILSSGRPVSSGLLLKSVERGGEGFNVSTLFDTRAEARRGEGGFESALVYTRRQQVRKGRSQWELLLQSYSTHKSSQQECSRLAGREFY